ncbi:NAD(P)H-hydrate dehydratase [Gemmobacter sp.]|uniref:NAD(P)H-hydrate dehydratase n=1 Tax=Gemmobacter sp. TaxID=1898957 RepID=UPI002B0000F9|nr:NAD(P)H-hydrate dehydratase [Gemmobacter sp.]
MTEVLTSAQMRAIEQAAIDSGTVTGLELMERAGAGVVQAILEEWPEFGRASGALPAPVGSGTDGAPDHSGQGQGARRAVVLCGPGNNGGDGFVVARLLRERGWEVRVLAAAPAEAMPRDAAVNAGRWRAYGPVEPLTERNLRAGPPNDLYVDAIFGTGLSRPPEGEILDLLTHIGGRGGDNAYYTPRLVAVDAPSVLCLDSGRSLHSGCHNPRARLTVTFDSPKAGHLLAQGPELCGRVVVADIGIASWRRLSVGAGGRPGPLRPIRLGAVEPAAGDGTEARLHPGTFDIRMLGKAGWAEAHAAHKFSHGHALVLSGGPGRGGAARLSARAALRIGAGLVTVACPPDALAENAARLDAVMLRPVADGAALAAVLEDRRITALCLGPGLETGLREKQLLQQALATQRLAEIPAHLADLPEAFKRHIPRHNATRPAVVCDADALTLLARHPDLFAALHDACVLTPHGGEFARLFPDIAARLNAPATKGPAYSKVDATRDAAARAGCVVLYKGPDTVIAAPDGRAAIHAAAYDRAAPWLATAGSGDVLAGFITGLLARGFTPFDAACTAAWLHVECARSFGPGLIAEDLPEELPKVFRALNL